MGHWAGGGVMSLGGAGSMHVAGRTALAAMAGGAAAELGGGKFENGAVSAAFAHLFNNESGKARKRMTPEQEFRQQSCGGPDIHCKSPTGHRVRIKDVRGEGHYGAPRRNEDGTRRKHAGLDFVVTEDWQEVRATTGGVVNDVVGMGPGFWYVEVETTNGKYLQRFLYLDPSVGKGADVKAGDVIGKARSLQSRYKGITDHVHFDVRKPNSDARIFDNYIDPTPLFSPRLFRPEEAGMR